MASTITVAKSPLGALAPVPDDASARRHHVRSAKGATTAFRNVHPSYDARALQGLSLLKALLRMLWGQVDGSLRFPDTTPPTGVDVVPPTFLPDRSASRRLRTTWLGHACHYVEFPSGLRVLFDPVLEERCSPLSFAGPRRYTPRPCAIADLPFVDAVVISHSHYDHLSAPTVAEIARRHPGAHFFVGLGLEKWFRSAGVTRVTEMDWWEDAELTVQLGGDDGGGGTNKAAPSTGDGGSSSSRTAPPSTVKALISCLPAQHTANRSLFDRNETLWCSWAVKSGGGTAPDEKSVYFGGDTGYRSVPELPAGEGDGEGEGDDDRSARWAHLPRNPDFAAIGRLRGPFDLGLLPIGAYAPRWVMSPVHSDPFDAVDIFRDTRCARALAIHWGTWALTCEPVLEPPRRLREALRRAGLAETGVFDVCDVGESRTF